MGRWPVFEAAAQEAFVAAVVVKYSELYFECYETKHRRMRWNTVKGRVVINR